MSTAAQHQHPVISSSPRDGLQVTAPDGRPAQFAIIDENGNVLDSGPHLARAAWDVSIESFKRFLKGRGFMRAVWPPEQSQNARQSLKTDRANENDY